MQPTGDKKMGREPKHPRAKHWAVSLKGIMLQPRMNMDNE
jgi:hypothetical protein